MFTTDRLIIRAFSEDDMKHLLDMANDLEIQNLVSDDYIVPKSANHEDVFRGWIKNNLLFGIITTKDGDFAGNISLIQRSVKNREAMLAIVLTKPYWSKGYGTEAMKVVINHGFKSLALHRISLGVFESNSRALGAYKKLGFIEEGRLRKHLWRDGEWEDIILMAILEDEWKALPTQRQ